MGHYWLFNIENSWFLDPSNVPSGTTDTIFPLIYSHHVGHPTSYHCTENGPFQMGENIDHSKTLTITLTVHANPGQTWNQNSNFAKYLTWVFTYRNCTINWFTDNFKHIWKANSLSIYHSAETSKVSRVWIPGWKIFYFCRQIQRQFFSSQAAICGKRRLIWTDRAKHPWSDKHKTWIRRDFYLLKCSISFGLIS